MSIIELESHSGISESTPLIAYHSKGYYLWKKVIWRVKSKLIYSKLTENSFEMTSPLRTLRRSSARIQENLSIWILYPDSKLKHKWNYILVIILIYTATVTPIRSCFIDPVQYDGWWWVDVTLDFLFLIDIIVNLSSAYIREDNTIETSRKIIFFRYLKTWMILDIFACFPVEFLQDEGSTSNKQLFKLLRLFRLYRLFKIFRMFKDLNRRKSKNKPYSEDTQVQSKDLKIKFEISPNLLFFIQFIMKTLIALHVISCLWYFSAKYNNFEPNTWVIFFGYEDYELPDLYLRSFYWAFTTLTTIGYGDIRPINDDEILIAIAWMAFGICFFSYTLGVLSSLMLTQNSKEIALNKKLFAVDEFVKEENLPNKLKKDMKDSLQYSNEKTGVSWEDKQAVFNELPAALRYEVAINLHSGAIEKFSFFMKKDKVFIATIVPFLKNLFQAKGEVVYSESDLASDVFFVSSGQVCLNHLEIPLKWYKTGKYFGDIEIICKVPRNFSAVCVKNSQFLTMSRNVVYFMLEEFPYYGNEMKITANFKSQKLQLSKRKISLFLELKNSGKIKGKEPEEIKEIIDNQIQAENLRFPNEESKNSHRKIFKIMNRLNTKIQETEQKLVLTKKIIKEIKKTFL